MKQETPQLCPTTEDFGHEIYAADLSSTLERLIHIDGWYKKSAETAITQYRNFLFLKKKYGDAFTLPPSYEVDEAWHAHILHTEEYTDFCMRIFGRYLHHRPHLAKEARSKEELIQLFQQTQSLYHKEFGDYLYSIPKRAYLQKIISLFGVIKVMFLRKISSQEVTAKIHLP